MKTILFCSIVEMFAYLTGHGSHLDCDALLVLTYYDDHCSVVEPVDVGGPANPEYRYCDPDFHDVVFEQVGRILGGGV